VNAVIVTGGAGYIGSHVCKALKKAGFTPVVFDHLEQGHEWAIQWGPFILGDILNKALLKDAFQKFSPVGVIHLASYINVRDSLVSPEKYYRNNLLGTLSLLEAMIEEGVFILIFSSSAAVYGNPTETPIKESHALAPLNPYGASKLMGERLIDDVSQAHDLSYAALRYFNAAGADPEGALGESHHPETHLIPRALISLLKKKTPLSIYGTDYPTPDGTALRDYIHVTDLASAHVQALSYLLDTPQQRLTLNLGTGKAHSVKEIIQTVESLTSCRVPIHIKPRISEDPSTLVADTKKASLLLNWKTNYSDLETIIETAWMWHQRHL
jgi:UDP-glucose-4-epimerase GalE